MYGGCVLLDHGLLLSALIFTSYKVTKFACTVNVTLPKGVLRVVVTSHRAT